jgi:hypothetical protein
LHSKTLSLKETIKKRPKQGARGMAQVVKNLLSKCEALSSKPRTPPQKKKKRKKTNLESQKKNNLKEPVKSGFWMWGFGLVVECQSSTCKALSLIPSIAKIRK